MVARINASSSSNKFASAAKPQAQDAPKTRRTRVAQAAVEEPHQDKPMSAFEELAAAQERLMASFKLPTWKRSLCAFVLSFATGWFVASGVMALVDMLLVTAIVAATPLFIQMLIAVLGIAIALWCAWKAGGYVGRFIFFGDADNLMGRGWGRVKSFFGGISAEDAAALQAAAV